MVDHDLAIGQVDERLLVRVLLHGWFSFLRSHRHQQVDTRRVSWEGGVTCPQPGDLDMYTSKMTSFLLLQALDCCLPGQSYNELREPCLFCCTHLVDPYALSADQQGQGSWCGMCGCSCLRDGGADRCSQGIAYPQGHRRFV